ncbi:MAG: 50S ribosomal protein L5 [Candidatus Magasanikbacteria bacterium RIFOXYD2_FULL_41_14]|uniref:Large ribosomal subunit protein uL5 n=1 Tax=Candidatus Magasanikbacteria bacterium RIFOXYD2_FULL_41_14 TaxID=1798709 RepID=A0A1F6PBY1_9BACT|nr:MAG: 50S ribosomal protein L5 [Candidatus Magasanikbacteria bacterium RIFOXYD2_FULL_41_14]
MINNLLQKYRKEVAPALMAEFGYKNIMQVPRIKKVIINVGSGRFAKDAAFLENIDNTLKKITGQKPVRTKAKKAISNFKIRENMDIGAMVTLRGKVMYDFLERMLDITLPRTRDFRGISAKSFDRSGNYTLGFKENSAFPELGSAEIDKVHGLEVVINIQAKNQEEGRALLTKLGFPFKK